MDYYKDTATMFEAMTSPAVGAHWYGLVQELLAEIAELRRELNTIREILHNERPDT
jgi:hypothetical protein